MRISDNLQFDPIPLFNFATGGVIGVAAATVDSFVFYQMNQTTAGQTLSLPSPTDTGEGHLVIFSNVGTAAFTMHGVLVPVAGTGQFFWNGTAWIAIADTSNDWKLLGNIGTVQATNFIGTADNIGFSIRTNNLIRQTVTDVGNVGIGNVAPLAKLAVQGSVVVGTTQTVVDIPNHIAPNILNAISPTQMATTAIAAPEAVLRMTRLGTAGPKFGASAEFRIGTDTVTNLAATVVRLVIGTAGSNVPNLDVMTFLHTGNVGIGTIAPSTRLEVDNVTVNTSGLRLTRLLSTSPTTVGQAIGVTATGDVVTVNSASTIPVVQTFTVSGTYTPTVGMKYAIATIIGSGGGGAGAGAGSVTTIGFGTGGGAGGEAEVLLTAAQIGVSQTITIGTAGAGGAAGVTAGATGTGTSLGALISCAGGAGGNPNGVQAGPHAGIGGLGGAVTVTTGTARRTKAGDAGAFAYASIGGLGSGSSGFGASSSFGAGGIGVRIFNPSSGALGGAGVSGSGKGSGGSGGISAGTGSVAQAGGAGTAGQIVITEYF